MRPSLGTEAETAVHLFAEVEALSWVGYFTYVCAVCLASFYVEVVGDEAYITSAEATCPECRTRSVHILDPSMPPRIFHRQAAPIGDLED